MLIKYANMPLIYFLISIVLLASPCVDAFYFKYMSLINDIYKHYGTSSVCLVLPPRSQDPDFTSMHKLTREFSRRGIPTWTIDMYDMKARLNKYQNKGVRPLVVVSLTSYEEISNFYIHSRQIEISYPIWLMIFETDDAVCRYCENLEKNTFGLRFDTEMLILCCKDPAVREWWAIGNYTRTLVFGTWTSENGFALRTSKSLYARRNEVNGIGLRIALVMNSAFRVEDDDVGGFYQAILTELKRVMNFTVIETISTNSFGSLNAVTKIWSGAMEVIASNKADLAVAEFSMLNIRKDYVDYTLPLMISQTKMYIRVLDGTGVQWTAHFKAFANRIWLTIIFLILTSTILVVIIKMRTGFKSFSHLVSENYLYVWGIFCQQGLAVFPDETPLRIAYCSVFISALVTSAAYSAALISFITVSSWALPFATLKEFIKDGSYRLIVLQNSSEFDLIWTSTSPVMQKIRTLMKKDDELPATMEEGFQQICDERVAFFVSEAMVNTARRIFPCQVASLTTGGIDSLAMIMPRKSEFTGVINYHIQRFEDNGMINRLKQMYLSKPIDPESTFKEVNLWGVAPILSVLAGGIMLALVVLILENFYTLIIRTERRFKKSNSVKTQSTKSSSRKSVSFYDENLIDPPSRFTWHAEYFNFPQTHFYP